MHETIVLKQTKNSYVCKYRSNTYSIRTWDNIKKGTMLELLSHMITAFDFEIIDILEINSDNLDITLSVKLISDNKLPDEFYTVFEQDEKYSNSYKYIGIRNTLEEAKDLLLEYGYGKVYHVKKNDIFETTAYENKRGL